MFWARVPVVDNWRFLLFPGNLPLERALEWATVAALVAAALGVWPRTACFLAGLFLYHLAPLETIFWTPNPFERGLTISVLALFTLSFSRCGDALRLLPARRPASAPLSGEYQWPLRLVQLFLCQVYFISGYAKLALAGPAWVSGSNISHWLLLFSQQDQVHVLSPELGAWLANSLLACWLIGIGGLALDLGLIAVVAWRRLRVWLIPTTMLFHVAILLTMGILFLNIPQFLVFVDWAALAERKRRRAFQGWEQPGAIAASR